MTITINGTTGIAGVDGTASVPAFKGNDADTGIFYPTANEVAAAAGGSSVWNASSTFGFKNRIINGGFTVWQRGTSFSGVTPSLGTPAYTADRWFVAQLTSQSATDVTQQTTGATRFAIRVQKRSGSTGASTNILGQEVENVNCLDLPGQQLTLSFTARAGANYSATSNALGVQIFTCTTADQSTASFVNGTAAGQATLLSQNVTLTTSNQRFTLTTSAVPSNATNVYIAFVEASSSSAAGANDWFEVSDVQLERGSVATSFDFRDYTRELQMCQRYFEKSYTQSSVPGAVVFSSFRTSIQATSQYAAINGLFATSKRTNPAVVVYNPSTGTAGQIVADSTNITSVSIATNETGLVIFCNNQNTTVNQFLSGHWTASAEL